MYISIDPSLNPLFWLALGLVGSVLSAQLAFAWTELVPQGTGFLSTSTRFTGASASLATGMWIAHATSVAVAFPGTHLAYNSTYLVAFFALAAFLSAISLLWSEHVRHGVAQWRIASVATGAAIAAVHILLLAAQHDLAATPSLLLLLALAIVLCAGGFFGATHRVKTYNGGHRSFLALIRTTAAAVWGITALAAFHAATIGFTGSRLSAPSPEHSWPLSICDPIAATAFLLLLRMALQIHLRTHAARLLESRRRGEQAAIDPLTKLANRHLFEATIAQVTTQAEAESATAALLVVGIDGAKSINQTFGYSEGDAVICEVSRRLRMLAKPHMVGRLSGDQFLMLIPTVADKAAVSFFAGKVTAAMAKPFAVAGRSTPVTVSIGIAMFPQHGAAPSLISHAESAMAQVKAAGGASHAFFDSRMIDQERERTDLLRDLRLALDQRELQLYYQPKIQATTGEVTGAEALIRWNHPTRGVVSPVDFIPLAERYGLIDQIGEWVIDEACRQVSQWRDAGMRMRVAVNISVTQLRQSDLAERVAAALQVHQIKPELITVEITESAAMDNTSSTLQVLAQLDAIGVNISIDDFGTGHSSLAYLRRLPADELKIDRSFVLDLETSDDARKVASAVINLAKALQLKVVAEGVETEGQNAILQRFGCDQLQGYLFGKPMPASALADWAMLDTGPRSLDFSDSLFKPTGTSALDPLDEQQPPDRGLKRARHGPQS